MDKAREEKHRVRFGPDRGSFSEFPFFRNAPRRNCFWCTPTTGSEDLDWKLGRLYARAFLKHVREERSGKVEHPLAGDEFLCLSAIIDDMIRAGNRDDDFINAFAFDLERYLAHAVRPESGWANITTELDARTWKSFEEQATQIWKAAPAGIATHERCCLGGAK